MAKIGGARTAILEMRNFILHVEVANCSFICNSGMTISLPISGFARLVGTFS
ncbi:hypothetical protein [uncultured Bartonella sp.]|uniref:hypothetical protein n=1 Tax=uncultured Bartonella sp. TaxID=104108 RepID=UPI002637911F|nr:hypothetical protein [uncultured Bartonella sp.]